MIAGNHDLLLDNEFVDAHPDRELGSAEELDWGGVKYLENGSVMLSLREREAKVFGCPMTPACGVFAFQYPRPHGKRAWDGSIPDGTDVMMAHGPPAGYLDGGVGGLGCTGLLGEVWRVRPRVVVFGHVHSARGGIWFDEVERCYRDILGARERGRRPWWVWARLWVMGWWVLCGVVMRVIGRRKQGDYCRLVNAAVLGGEDGRERREPIVVWV